MTKLLGAEEQVIIMKSQLQALQPILVSTANETNELLVQISSDKIEAEKTRGIVEAEEAVVTVKATEAKAIREDCEAELAVVSTTSSYFFAVVRPSHFADVCVYQILNSRRHIITHVLMTFLWPDHYVQYWKCFVLPSAVVGTK